MTLPPKYPLQTLMATEASAVAELNKILVMSVNRLDQDIKALGKAGANPLTLMQAKATKAAMESFLAETFDAIEGNIALGIKNAAAAASGVVSAYEAQMLGLVMSPEAVANLAKSEAQRAAMGIEAALQRVQGNSYVPLSDTVYKTQQLTLKWVDKRIAQGLASGWSASKLANELKGMIDPAVKGGVSYAAMRTARTEINNAFHASSAERYNNSPIVQEVDWHLSSSHPEGDICDDLAANSPYPKKSVPHKPHPNCYCYITPSLPEPAKFVDNLFKGKYGSPPTAAAAKTVKANVPAAAGSKAASNLAQNAMHQAIKTDKAPTKTSIANRLKLESDLTPKIVDPQAVADLLAKLDDEGYKWLKGNSAAKTMISQIETGVDDLDDLAAWVTKQANGTKPGPSVAQVWDEPIPDIDLKIVWDDEAYDDLLQYMDGDYIDTLKSNSLDPFKTKSMIADMDEQEFLLFKKIMFKAEGDPESIKHLVAVYDLDPLANSFTGDLAQLAKGAAPKKVPTIASVSEDFPDFADAAKLLDKHGMTADQIEAQLKKFDADELALIKKQTVNDQGYYIKSGTTPTKDAFDKPTTPPEAPTYKSLAKQLNMTEDQLIDSGATPQQITFFLKGDKASQGFEEIFMQQSHDMKITYLNSAKNVKMSALEDKDAWMKQYGFVDDVADVPKSYYTFEDLEMQYGTPSHVWEGSGWTADDIKGAIDWIDEYDEVLQKQLMDAFDDFDQDGLFGTIESAIKKKAKAPIVDPPTIPAPKIPDVLPAPKELYDSYEDVADIFVKGEWKPNLLAKTGASPQQIADYVEDMSQAQYDHFMGLKWPSQKKHFEKLAESKVDNAAAYQVKIETAQGVALDASKIKPPLSSDPEVIAKWRGKAQPGKPIEPKPPTTPGKVAYDDFLEKSKKKFADFAKSTGNPKNDLTKSNNWSYFQNVVNNNDLTALKYLQTNKYIDQDLYDLAVAAGKKATTPDAGDAAAYKRAMDEYASRKAAFDADLVQWREANGITSQAKGVWDGALVHADNGAGVRWANSNLPTATGEAKSAVIRYSGSSYREWNDALRKNASGDTVPSGSWAEYTRKADKAMVPMPEDVIVRRGTGWNEFIMDGSRNTSVPPPPPHSLIGSVQTQHGYTSTSVGKTSAFGGQVNMRIRVPQGHGAAWVDPYSAHKGERELLLSRSTNYYIHDVYQENGVWYVDAEVVPFGEDASTWTPIKSANRR